MTLYAVLLPAPGLSTNSSLGLLVGRINACVMLRSLVVCSVRLVHCMFNLSV